MTMRKVAPVATMRIARLTRVKSGAGVAEKALQFTIIDSSGHLQLHLKDAIRTRTARCR